MEWSDVVPTFLCEAPPAVGIEFLGIARHLHSGVAAGTRQRNLHWLVEELETLDLVDRLLCRLRVVEDDEGLTLRLQVCLGDDINHFAILREDDIQCILEDLWLDALFEVADVDAGWVVSQSVRLLPS